MLPSLGRQKHSRANSDVSQMDEGAMGKRISSPDVVSPQQTPSPDLPDDTPQKRGRSTSDSSANTASTSLPATQAHSPIIAPNSAPSKPHLSLPSSPRQRPFSPDGRQHTAVPPPQTRQRKNKKPSAQRMPTGSAALSGTIARATVDTTLAVIPAEAFRKLTKKFPKASGTVVQVVLERFSRVTFMTGE